MSWIKRLGLKPRKELPDIATLDVRYRDVSQAIKELTMSLKDELSDKLPKVDEYDTAMTLYYDKYANMCGFDTFYSGMLEGAINAHDTQQIKKSVENIGAFSLDGEANKPLFEGESKRDALTRTLNDLGAAIVDSDTLENKKDLLDKVANLKDSFSQLDALYKDFSTLAEHNAQAGKGAGPRV